MATPLRRPAPADAAAYYFKYIDLVPNVDVLELLTHSLEATRGCLAGLGPEQELLRYAPGKWTIREVVGHILDAERVFGYRAFHMARGDRSPLPGMEQDDYAATCGAAGRPLAELLDELAHVRAGHLGLFRSFDKKAWERTGTASGMLFRVRSLPFIVAGHEIHHRRILVERYLTGSVG